MHQSPCQISSKLVENLQIYDDLMAFKMAAVRAGAIKRPILHHRTTFRKNQSNRCGDIAIL